LQSFVNLELAIPIVPRCMVIHSSNQQKPSKLTYVFVSQGICYGCLIKTLLLYWRQIKPTPNQWMIIMATQAIRLTATPGKGCPTLRVHSEPTTSSFDQKSFHAELAVTEAYHLFDLKGKVHRMDYGLPNTTIFSPLLLGIFGLIRHNSHADCWDRVWYPRKNKHCGMVLVRIPVVIALMLAIPPSIGCTTRR
jgi:hypothetical protein